MVFDCVAIDGAIGVMGTNAPIIRDDGEGPLRTSRLRPFKIGKNPVSNHEFAEFVAATGYVTEAERIGWSFVFWSDVPKEIPQTQAIQGLEWWRRVDGAHWRNITGGLDASLLPDHPVVQVSWNDAKTFAAWAGGRLPKEAEWEHAARGGLGDVLFPWGNQEPDDREFFPCNIWQGRFPQHNSLGDGFATTAPAGTFAPNGYGLYNMVGNVWEWTAEPFKIPSLRKSAQARQASMKGFKLSKGGSFLCHKSYCYRYRIAARTGSSADSATTHQGFRVVWDHDPAKP